MSRTVQDWSVMVVDMNNIFASVFFCDCTAVACARGVVMVLFRIVEGVVGCCDVGST